MTEIIITNPNAEIRSKFKIELPEKKRSGWSHRDSRHVQELRSEKYTIRKIAEILHCSTWHVQQSLKGNI